MKKAAYFEFKTDCSTFSHDSMKTITLLFPSIIQLIDFENTFQSKIAHSNRNKLTISGDFSSNEIESAITGYKAILVDCIEFWIMHRRLVMLWRITSLQTKKPHDFFLLLLPMRGTALNCPIVQWWQGFCTDMLSILLQKQNQRSWQTWMCNRKSELPFYRGSF